MNEAYLKDLKSGYYQDNGNLKIAFVDGYPQDVARILSDAAPAMSTKQARSFFDVVNKIYMATTLNTKSFDDAVIDLRMLKSRVSDKLGKGFISDEFNKFIVSNVDATKSLSDLKAFTLHFEAVCNYLRNDKSKPKPQNNYNGNRGNNYNKPYDGQKFRSR